MDWLRETQWLWWVAAALALGLIEIASLDLVFSMLAIAAVVTAGAAFLGAPLPVQVLVFVATSVLLLMVLRPVAKRRFGLAGEGARTNTAAHVGRTAFVLSEVTDRTGLVKLAGEEWTARSEAGTPLPTGARVNVIRIEGATAIVQEPPQEPADPEADTQADTGTDSDDTPSDPTDDRPGGHHA